MNNDLWGHSWGDLPITLYSWHSWKSLANRPTRDPKIVIHGNSCIILYIFIWGTEIDKHRLFPIHCSLETFLFYVFT